MPRYDYRCLEHGVFEQQGRLDEDVVSCVCGQPARRCPYSGVPYLKGETVSRNIPDPEYKTDAQKRELRGQGWDIDRSVRTMRKGLVETEAGKVLDMNATRVKT